MKVKKLKCGWSMGGFAWEFRNKENIALMVVKNLDLKYQIYNVNKSIIHEKTELNTFKEAKEKIIELLSLS